MQRRKGIVIGLWATVLLVAGCSGGNGGQPVSANVIASMSGEADAAYARAYEPVAFSFPRDHGAHPEYKTEWWYYTGNLAADDGSEYGYQFTIFRNSLAPGLEERTSTWATNQVYMGHFALTDVSRDRHFSFERFGRGGGGLAGATGDPAYSVWLDDWSVTESEPGVQQVIAGGQSDEGPVRVALTLRESGPPVLHGEQGLSQKGPEPGNASYYYSLVGLESSGVVTAFNRSLAVTGLSWMDHEFGTSALGAGAVGWDWFSLQFDNGASLMFATIRGEDGAAAADFAGTLRHPDGRVETIHTSDLVVERSGSWTSPRTAAVYPSGWRVQLPAQQLEFTVTPLVDDQEMQVSFVYWRAP
jgi:predicted secreted hydrolase